MNHRIEARSFRVLLAGCHNFWVLKNADGVTLAELHGLAYDRLNKKIVPIGTTRNHSLRVFAYAHDARYARESGLALGSTRMYWKSRAKLVYEAQDALDRWSAALEALPILNELDLTYPPFGFNVRNATVNSNSAYRTFGEIMGISIPTFPGVVAPGSRDRMLEAEALATLAYRPSEGARARDRGIGR